MSAVYRLTTSLDACLQCGVQWNLCLALKTALVALRAFETLAPLSERCIVHILHRAAHIPWALLWDVAFKAGQCSARLWHCPKSWKGICGIFPILPQCSVSFDSQGEEGTIRVAEVGNLSAKAKNAFNSFVRRVFANTWEPCFTYSWDKSLKVLISS